MSSVFISDTKYNRPCPVLLKLKMYVVIRLIPVPTVIEELLVEDIAQLCNIRVASNIVGKQTP